MGGVGKQIFVMRIVSLLNERENTGMDRNDSIFAAFGFYARFNRAVLKIDIFGSNPEHFADSPSHIQKDQHGIDPLFFRDLPHGGDLFFGKRRFGRFGCGRSRNKDGITFYDDIQFERVFVEVSEKGFYRRFAGISARTGIDALLHLICLQFAVTKPLHRRAMLPSRRKYAGCILRHFREIPFRPAFVHLGDRDLARVDIIRVPIVFGKQYQRFVPRRRISDRFIDRLSFFIPADRFSNRIRVSSVPRKLYHRSVSVRIFHRIFTY